MVLSFCVVLGEIHLKIDRSRRFLSLYFRNNAYRVLARAHAPPNESGTRQLEDVRARQTVYCVVRRADVAQRRNLVETRLVCRPIYKWDLSFSSLWTQVCCICLHVILLVMGTTTVESVVYVHVCLFSIIHNLARIIVAIQIILLELLF